MAKLGHEVIGFDTDEKKIEQLSHGIPPFFEPDLQEILTEGIKRGNLRFTGDISALKDASVHFLAVGTPQSQESQAADLTYVQDAIDELCRYLKPGDLVVGKSTVPVGTAEKLTEAVKPTGALLAWNPEFLREGFAVQDTISPDRIVYGVPAGDAGRKATTMLDEVYAQALVEGIPRITTDLATAELVKVSANAFLATKISFINAIAEITETVGADVITLADAIGLDDRIGRKFLGAGIGFGGGCLPKDIRAFTARAEELGKSSSVAFLKEIDAINLRRRARAAELTVEALGGQVVGKKISILGAAFKPNSDDVRDSPALDVAIRLRSLGADVTVTDPQAIDNAKRSHPHLNYEASIERALVNANAVLLATEWSEYKNLDPNWAAEVTSDMVIVDGRNCLDSIRWREAGWRYFGMGKP